MVTTSKRWTVVAILSKVDLSRAHGLPVDRLTLLMRDATRILLAYFIDYPAALLCALAPQRTLQDFVLTYSVIPSADFQNALITAPAKFSAHTRLVPAKKRKQNTPSAAPPVLTRWHWPDVKATQAVLQQRTMQAIVGADERPRDQSFEILAEVTAAQAVTALEVRLPNELGNGLVVSYQSQQAWAEPRSAGLMMKF